MNVLRIEETLETMVLATGVCLAAMGWSLIAAVLGAL
jgi:hypothetical protein